MPQCLRHVFLLIAIACLKPAVFGWPGMRLPKGARGVRSGTGSPPPARQPTGQGNQPALRIPLGTIGWRRRETSSLAPEQLLLPEPWGTAVSTRAATAERQLFIRGPAALAGGVTGLRGKL